MSDPTPEDDIMRQVARKYDQRAMDEMRERAERAEQSRDTYRRAAKVEHDGRVAAEGKLTEVREVLNDIEHPNPEADQDWHDDPVTCIRDALRAALKVGEDEG